MDFLHLEASIIIIIFFLIIILIRTHNKNYTTNTYQISSNEIKNINYNLKVIYNHHYMNSFLIFFDNKEITMRSNTFANFEQGDKLRLLEYLKVINNNEIIFKIFSNKDISGINFTIKTKKDILYKIDKELFDKFIIDVVKSSIHSINYNIANTRKWNISQVSS